MYKPSKEGIQKTHRISITSHVHNAKDAGVALLRLAMGLIFRVIERRKATKGPEIETPRGI